MHIIAYKNTFVKKKFNYLTICTVICFYSNLLKIKIFFINICNFFRVRNVVYITEFSQRIDASKKLW